MNQRKWRGAQPPPFTIAVYIVAGLCVSNAFAQSTSVVARTSAVTGQAVLRAPGLQPLALTAGYVLNPGDRIDTRGGGRVVIDLSDGSMVVVSPESIVTLKDYRAAASLRELFGITLGMVRVKINHFAGKPNPYRMNSPTASIAVRGTEFSIEVSPQGDTQVVVYEGAVEVSSLTDPARRVLIEAGRGVLVQGGQDFHLIAAAQVGQPGDAMRAIAAAQADRNRGASGAAGQRRANGQPGATGPPPDRKLSPGPLLRNPPPTARRKRRGRSKQRGLLCAMQPDPTTIATTRRAPAPGPTTVIWRVSPISHKCRSCSASTPSRKRIWTAWRIPRTPRNSVAPKGGSLCCRHCAARRPCRSINPRSAPAAISRAPTASLRRFRISLHSTGSILAAASRLSRVGNSSLTSTPDYDPGTLDHNIPSTTQTNGSSGTTYYTGALVGSRRFGANSFGLELALLNGTGSSSTVTSQSEGAGHLASEILDSTTAVHQTRLTAGYSRDLSRDAKFGIYYRYAFIGDVDQDVNHTINGFPAGLNSTHTGGHSSEFGMRLRGLLTPRLYYGIAAAWLGISLLDGMTRATTVDSHERDRAQRGSIAIGLGYALTRSTTLSFDLAGGTARTWASRTEDGTGALLQNAVADSHFTSAHLAVQSDVTRRLFLTASFLNIWQKHALNVDLFPDQFGNRTLVEDSFFPMTSAPSFYAPRFSDFGAGWRFTRDLFAQYVYSTDYGASSATHTLMVRYTFQPRESK